MHLALLTEDSIDIDIHAEHAAERRREVTQVRRQIVLDGKIGKASTPRRTLDCMPLHAGLWCEHQFGPALVTIMTNKKQMIETITDPTSGKEYASIAYVCNGAFKL